MRLRIPESIPSAGHVLPVHKSLWGGGAVVGDVVDQPVDLLTALGAPTPIHALERSAVSADTTAPLPPPPRP